MCLPFHHDARPKAEMGFEPIPIVLQTTAIAIYATQQSLVRESNPRLRIKSPLPYHYANQGVP